MIANKLQHTLNCNRTGVPLGTLTLNLAAGHMPYLSHWHDMVCYHPLFSLSPSNLCKFLDNEWRRLGTLVVEEQASEKEELVLRIGFVAGLYGIATITQDKPCLPSIGTVATNLQSLLMLSTWKYHLESKRFKFPDFHITEAALDHISDYLTCCWDARKAWEIGLREQDVKRAEAAVLAVRNNFFKPTSKKVLWNWIKDFIPEPYKNDGWLFTIFMSSSSTIIDWDSDDLTLFDEILQSAIPMGSGSLGHAVRERIKAIKASWADYHDAFIIEDDAEAAIQEVTKDAPVKEPTLKDFNGDKAKFFKARAIWQLSQRS